MAHRTFILRVTHRSPRHIEGGGKAIGGYKWNKYPGKSVRGSSLSDERQPQLLVGILGGKEDRQHYQIAGTP